jgi:hypothetical protein
LLVRDTNAEGTAVKAIKQIFVGIIDPGDVDGCAALKEVGVLAFETVLVLMFCCFVGHFDKPVAALLAATHWSRRTTDI